MKRKKIILIWIVFLSPFFGFLTIKYLARISAISEYETSIEKINKLADNLFLGDDNKTSFQDLENPDNNQATIVYSSDGLELTTFHLGENRTNVKYDSISPVLIDALISTEDIRFRSHSGFDTRSFLRAIFGVVSGKNSGGASTISQQLAKQLFTRGGNNERIKQSTTDRLRQKVKEWVLATELEKRYSKNEIIEMYLNKFDWINGAAGIHSASKIYFSTTPDKLTINQSAMLVGMLVNPSEFDPLRNKQATIDRRNVVLYQMMKNNKIKKEEYKTLIKDKTLGLKLNKGGHDKGIAKHYRIKIQKEAKDWCEENNYALYTDGLKIYTTLDTRMQEKAEASVKNHMTQLQDDFFNHMKNREHPFNGLTDVQIQNLLTIEMKKSDRYRKLKKRGASEEMIRKIFADGELVKIESLFSWDNNPKRGNLKNRNKETCSPMDSILYYKYFIHTGLMSVDPKTGHVKAYVGGIDYNYIKYDHVTQGKRQVGSTIKPFLYSIAIEDAGMSPCDKISNTPFVFHQNKWDLDTHWIPENSSGKFDGANVSIKFGLANSLNIISAYLMDKIKPMNLVAKAKDLGIKSKLDAVPSLCLGTFDISVYEMTGAYSTFANNGVYVEPIFITRIEDKNGNILADFYPKTEEVLNEKTAALMVEMLKGVVDGVRETDTYKTGEKKGTTIGTHGTGISLKSKRYPYKLKSEIGGKTGTTQNYSDGWFVGVTPDLVTTVWTGCADRSAHFRNQKGYSTETALPIFGYFMRMVYDDSEKRAEEFIKEKDKELLDVKSLKRTQEIEEKYQKKIDLLVRETDLFEYSSRDIKDWVVKKMACETTEFNPDIDYENEEF